MKKEMAEGGSVAAALIKSGIVSAASDMAGAQAGAKTRSDLRQIAETGGSESFIRTAGVDGAKKGVVARTQFGLNSGEKTQNFIDDLDSNVLQRQSSGQRSRSIQDMKTAGIITEDSTEGNLKATTGETFALGMAKLSAGSMSKDDRFMIGEHAVNTVRNFRDGHAKVDTNASSTYTDGDQVNHNFGVNYKNPMQYLANKAGVSTVAAGTDGASVSDNIAGYAVLATTSFTTGALGKKIWNKVSRKNYSSSGSTHDQNSIPIKKDIPAISTPGNSIKNAIQNPLNNNINSSTIKGIKQGLEEIYNKTDGTLGKETVTGQAQSKYDEDKTIFLKKTISLLKL